MLPDLIRIAKDLFVILPWLPGMLAAQLRRLPAQAAGAARLASNSARRGAVS